MAIQSTVVNIKMRFRKSAKEGSGRGRRKIRGKEASRRLKRQQRTRTTA